jgi:hypothetical protein
MRRSWFLAAALAAAALPVQGQSATPREWRLGNWYVSAHADPQTGQFSHCAATAVYRSGVNLLFGVSRSFAWSVGLHHDGWQLQPGATYPIQLLIDGAPIGTMQAHALDGQEVGVLLPEQAVLLDRMRRGRWLKVRAAGQDFDFQLEGSARMLDGLFGCASSGGRTAEPAPRSADRGGGEGRVTAEEALEGTRIFATLVADGAFPGAVILAGKDVPEFLRGSAAVWQTDTLLGAVRILRPGVAPSLDAVATGLVARASAACAGGTFASGVIPETEEGLRHVFSGCEKPGRPPLYARYLTLDRPQGGHYVIATYSTASPAEAETENRAVRNVVFRAVAKP